MHRFDFTDDEWLEAIAKIAMPQELKDWVIAQAQRGQRYYLDRIQQLGLKGSRVLDAGCGMGNWTMALAGFFEEVHALDIDAVRLSVVEAIAPRFGGRIRTKPGSVEQLDFRDEFFDAVYCNGVIFLTDYTKSLRELRRVLKEGGQLYLCFNGRDWWKHLIFNRGPQEPACIFFGCNGLISLLFRYLNEIKFGSALGEGSRDKLSLSLRTSFGKNSKLTLWKTIDQLKTAFDRYTADAGESLARESFEKDVIDVASGELDRLDSDHVKSRKSRDAREILTLLLSEGGKVSRDLAPTPYKSRVIRDLASRIIFAKPDYALNINTYSFEPEDMTEELARAGFRNILASYEGTLRIDQSREATTPIYPPCLGVFEVVATRTSYVCQS